MGWNDCSGMHRFKLPLALPALLLSHVACCDAACDCRCLRGIKALLPPATSHQMARQWCQQAVTATTAFELGTQRQGSARRISTAMASTKQVGPQCMA